MECILEVSEKQEVQDREIGPEAVECFFAIANSLIRSAVGSRQSRSLSE